MMSISLSCEKCGKTIQAPEALAGKSGKCPGCKSTIQVPQAAPAPPQETAPRQLPADMLDEIGPAGPTDWADDVLGSLSDQQQASPLGPLAQPKAKRSGGGWGLRPPNNATGVWKSWVVVRGAIGVLMGAMTIANVIYYMEANLFFTALLLGPLGAVATGSCFGGRPMEVALAWCAENRLAILSVGVGMTAGIMFFTRYLILHQYWIPSPETVRLIYWPFKILALIFVISTASVLFSLLDYIRSWPVMASITGITCLLFLFVGTPATLKVIAWFPSYIDEPEQSIAEIDAHLNKIELPKTSMTRELSSGVLRATVFIPRLAEQNGSFHRRVVVHLPKGEHADKSLPCVMIGASGSNGFCGVKLDEWELTFNDKFAELGMVVVSFDIDGAIPEVASERQMASAYQHYRAASGGLFNAELALRYALEKLPMVDPERIIASGHSSAASLALVWAAQQPRIKAAIVSAPGAILDELLAADVKLLSAYENEYPGVREFVHKMTPVNHTAQITCPVFLYHSRDDQVIPVQVGRDFAESLKANGTSVEFVSSSTGGHSPLMGKHLARAEGWLQKQGLLPSSTTEDAIASKDPLNPIANPQETELAVKRIAEKPDNSTDAPTSSDTTDPSVVPTKSPPKLKAYSSRDLPKADSGKEYRRLTQIDFILSDDATAIERMRWRRGDKRLALTARWGVGLMMVGKTTQPTIKRAWDLRGETGPVGELLASGLKQRTRNKQFGDRPVFGGLFYTDPELASGTKKQLIESAEREGLDGLVILEVESKVAGLNRKKRSTMIARVIDLHGAISDWKSEKLSSGTATKETTSRLAEAVLKQIDTHYVLDPITQSELNREVAKTDIRGVIQEKREDHWKADPLELVARLRYYLALQLMSPEEVTSTCDLLFEKGAGAEIFEGSWQNRLAALQRLSLAAAAKKD